MIRILFCLLTILKLTVQTEACVLVTHIWESMISLYVRRHSLGVTTAMVLSSKVVDIVLDVPVERIEPIVWTYIQQLPTHFTVCFNPMSSNYGFSILIDTIRSGVSIIYLRVTYRNVPIVRTSVPEIRFILENSANPDDMRVMWYFMWVFTVLQSIYPFRGFQYTKG